MTWVIGGDGRISHEEPQKCRVGTFCWTGLEFSTVQITEKITENGNGLDLIEKATSDLSPFLSRLLLGAKCEGSLHLKPEALMREKDYLALGCEPVHWDLSFPICAMGEPLACCTSIVWIG